MAQQAKELPPQTDCSGFTGYRLVNSKFPPVGLFDDVAHPEEFEALYQLQAMTNPRLRNEVGNLALLPASEIPFGIPGCTCAVAPFTHVNPDGSRFSDGRYGVLYLADSFSTALAEVVHHQARYWGNVPGLGYDRIVLRGLKAQVGPLKLHDITGWPGDDPVLSPEDYSASRALGRSLYEAGSGGIHYPSVRNKGGLCWGLFSPRPVRKMLQSSHYELVWDGASVSSVNKLVRQSW